MKKYIPDFYMPKNEIIPSLIKKPVINIAEGLGITSMVIILIALWSRYG